MDKIKIIEVKESIFEENDRRACELREELKSKGTLFINLMASPGAGKTTLLESTISRLKSEISIGVMEADIDANVDAERIVKAGARSIQIHTGGMCHMDSGMTAESIKAFGIEGLDLIFLENVGNLVCPAEFDTGAHYNVMILSVPEGDDKPLKYPLMFEVSDIVIISKIDTKTLFSFNDDIIVERIKRRNPNARVIFLSAKTGEGMDIWCDWLSKAVSEFKKI